MLGRNVGVFKGAFKEGRAALPFAELQLVIIRVEHQTTVGKRLDGVGFAIIVQTDHVEIGGRFVHLNVRIHGMDIRLRDMKAVPFDLEAAEGVVRALIVQIFWRIDAQQFELETPINLPSKGWGGGFMAKVLDTCHLPLPVKVTVLGHLVASNEGEGREEEGEEVFGFHDFCL